MKKIKNLTRFLITVFLAALIIGCSASSTPEKPAKDDKAAADKTPGTDDANKPDGTGDGATGGGGTTKPDGTGNEGTTTNDPPAAPYTKIGTKTINGKEYDIVTFGVFPQTIKDDSVSVDESDIKQNGIYTYYKGSDGEWYAKHIETENGSVSDWYYCKVEPVSWRLITGNYDHDNNPSTPGKKLLLAESILDKDTSFYDCNTNRTIENETVYPNDYRHSTIRAYLNGLTYIFKSNVSRSTETEKTQYSGKGFLQMAFTAEEQC